MTEYVVVGAEPIITQDLADAIRALEPLAVVTVLRSPSEALLRLPVQLPSAMILHREPDGFHATPLGQALASAKVPVGFLCAEGSGAGAAAILLSPFSDRTVQVLLDRFRAIAPMAD